MTTTSQTERPRLKFPSAAYQFMWQALQYTQKRLRRPAPQDPDDQDAHISGRELLEGIRLFAREQFGLLAIAVFRQWGVHTTEDFGRIVFEMVERGEMSKTDRDRLSDFCDVYEFDEVFDRDYRVETRRLRAR
ncbi:MAG TPA: Minf_1886 family protein [Planctomycetaceae bacterium]|nr:Minf_1886 family protein [Planctomycetaceae bacterium]